MALRESITSHSQVTKPVPVQSYIVSSWSPSVVHQELIGNSGDVQESGADGDCQIDVANRHGAEFQKSRFERSCTSNGYAGDLRKSGSEQENVPNGSVREAVLNRPEAEPQTCGSPILGNHSPVVTESFSLAKRQPDLAPPPTPPPPPGSRELSSSSIARNVCACRMNRNLCVTKQHLDVWDYLFLEGFKADVAINTEDGGVIAAHSIVLTVASPVLRSVLEDPVSWPCSIAVKGVPYNAAKVFVRFLYSSRYEEQEMKDFCVHLLVLSHAYCVPSMKRLCTYHLEHGLLTNENVVDMLQLARLCDAPRLHLLCYRIILNLFKEVSRTEGWRVMRDSNPELEQELVEAVIDSDYRRQEKMRKMEDDKVYEQLHDAMEALVHICRDGCRSIGPHDKMVDPNKQGPCNYPACKGLESLVRHFAACKLKVSGGCVHCKRMWQLLELHSQMCQEASCKVPLCGHFKNKICQAHNERREMRWKLLVKKIVSAKSATSAFSFAALSAKLECIA